MFRNVLIWLGLFLAATIVVYIAVVIGTASVWQAMGVHDRDGGGMMGLAFIIGPAIALPCGAGIAFLGLRFINRRNASTRAWTPEDTQRDSRRFLVLGAAVAAFFAAFWLVRFAFWLASPIRLDSYWIALMLSWLPDLAGAAAAIAAGFAVTRRGGRGLVKLPGTDQVSD
ncbi:MAG: hypothetical protein AB7F96_16720 [Beijerinckiaceae bacterium]